MWSEGVGGPGIHVLAVKVVLPVTSGVWCVHDNEWPMMAWPSPMAVLSGSGRMRMRMLMMMMMMMKMRMLMIGDDDDDYDVNDI